MTGAPGVRCVEPDTGDQAVHVYRSDDYGLDDIPELFRLGRLESGPGQPVRLTLTASEIRELKTLADAYSFDFDEGLIALCVDLHHFAIERPEARFVLIDHD